MHVPLQLLRRAVNQFGDQDNVQQGRALIESGSPKEKHEGRDQRSEIPKPEAVKELALPFQLAAVGIDVDVAACGYRSCAWQAFFANLIHEIDSAGDDESGTSPDSGD